MSAAAPEIQWRSPGAVASSFMKSDAFVRGIRGHIGSGKSVTCCIELMRRALAQKPNKEKVRKTRWAVIRNTNPELRTTTIKTWREWFDDRWGRFYESPPYTHMVKMRHPSGDGTRVEAEFIFLPLDKPSDIKKLLSLELTGAWINEAREVPLDVVNNVTSRVGRFPTERDGGPSWSGVIMDTNAPSEIHWWAIMSGEVDPPDYMTAEERALLIRPEGWEFYTQPPAMIERYANDNVPIYDTFNPDRENQEGVKEIYYKQLIPGKTRQWIQVYVLNQYRTIFDGKPVYPTFARDFHVSRGPLKAIEGIPLSIGIDFGRTPAAILGQELDDGQWWILKEILGFNMSARRFARRLIRELARDGYLEGTNGFAPKFVIRAYGDPSGVAQSQTEDTTPFRIMRSVGLPILPAFSNDLSIRIETVELALDTVVKGQPGLLIDGQACPNLVAGFEGGYKYKVPEDIARSLDPLKEEPDKNRFSHPHDALQYLLMSGGGRAAITAAPAGDARITKAKVGFNPHDRSRRAMSRGGLRRGTHGPV